MTCETNDAFYGSIEYAGVSGARWTLPMNRGIILYLIN